MRLFILYDYEQQCCEDTVGVKLRYTGYIHHYHYHYYYLLLELSNTYTGSNDYHLSSFFFND